MTLEQLTGRNGIVNSGDYPLLSGFQQADN